MLDLAPIVARLRAKCPKFKDVDFAFSKAEAMADVKRYPSLYVLQGKATGGKPSLASKAYMQQIVERFEVYSFLSARGVGVSSSKRSEQLKDVVKAHTDELELALLGWTPSAYVSPLSFISSDVVELTPERLVLCHTLETDFQYRKLDLT